MQPIANPVTAEGNTELPKAIDHFVLSLDRGVRWHRYPRGYSFDAVVLQVLQVCTRYFLRQRPSTVIRSSRRWRSLSR